MLIQVPLQEHQGDGPGHQEDVPQQGQGLPEERHRQEGDHPLQEVGYYCTVHPIKEIDLHIRFFCIFSSYMLIKIYFYKILIIFVNFDKNEIFPFFIVEVPPHELFGAL